MQIRARGFMPPPLITYWAAACPAPEAPAPWLSAAQAELEFPDEKQKCVFSAQKWFKRLQPWLVLWTAVHFKGCSELLKVVFTAKKHLNIYS